MFTDPYLATVTVFGGNFAPLNWALCNGQLMPISGNEALFTLIGTTYGGDGVNNFALPDFRSRVAIHAGQGNGLSSFVLGQSGGNESIILSNGQLASHTHVIVSVAGKNPGASTSSTNNVNIPTNNVPAIIPNIQAYESTGAATMLPTSVSAQSGITGSSQPLNILSPFQAINYIICVAGIFPSRN